MLVGGELRFNCTVCDAQDSIRQYVVQIRVYDLAGERFVPIRFRFCVRFGRIHTGIKGSEEDINPWIEAEVSCYAVLDRNIKVGHLRVVEYAPASIMMRPLTCEEPS
jgi:hypothetical protein